MYPRPIQKLIEVLKGLPGIGSHTAERLVFHLVKKPPKEIKEFADVLMKLKEGTKTCPQCFINMEKYDASRKEYISCSVCRDTKREKNLIMVLEDDIDAAAVERTKNFSGVYHILGGILPQIKGEKQNFRFQELLLRTKNLKKNLRTSQDLKLKNIEIIIATNPSVEGDLTAFYLEKLLRPLDVKITRIGRGLPTGADLEYADEESLIWAIKGRRVIEKK